jgi:hypothetical protein
MLISGFTIFLKLVDRRQENRDRREGSLTHGIWVRENEERTLSII